MADIVRFAPSPTGYLHVGGARTAIFNWLIAQKGAGKFLLRIEDTDQERSTEASVKQIIASLKWLGLNWDGEIYFQSRHLERHRQVGGQLLDTGKAYRCFCTREELAEKRRLAEQREGGYLYDGTCRNLSTDQVGQFLHEERPYSIRLKLSGQHISFIDLIIGETAIEAKTLDDFILLRSDNRPVYQLAVVVDDHDMGITKVLRGADHLLNTFKQILIYRALEWSHPEFGHLPLILGPDKTRLSKRHGATSVEEFIKQGILPEAMFNYLCLLGWSPGDDSEMMDRREIVERFDQSRINKSAAVFDIKKLLWMNGKYLAQQSARILRSELNDWLMDQKYTLSADEEERFHFLIDLYKIRCNTFEELKQALTVYFKIPQEYDAKGLNKYFRQEQSVKLLKKFFTEVRASDEHVFDEIGQTEVFVRQWAEQQQIAAAKIIHPLRLALTGKMESPGIFELIYVLGKTKIEERIKKALEVIEKSQ